MFHRTTLLFDVFGTTVDWRSSIATELEAFGQAHEMSAEWDTVADRWRAGFRDLQGKLARGERPWITMDQIHREVLDGLLKDLGATRIAESAVANLNRSGIGSTPGPIRSRD